MNIETTVYLRNGERQTFYTTQNVGILNHMAIFYCPAMTLYYPIETIASIQEIER